MLEPVGRVTVDNSHKWHSHMHTMALLGLMRMYHGCCNNSSPGLLQQAYCAEVCGVAASILCRGLHRSLYKEATRN